MRSVAEDRLKEFASKSDATWPTSDTMPGFVPALLQRCPDSHGCTLQLSPVSTPLSVRGIERLTGRQNEVIREYGRQQFERIEHDDCAPLSPAPHDLKPCYFACRCLCRAGGALDGIVDALAGFFRAHCRPKTPGRLALKAGDVVLELRNQFFGFWAHVSYSNLNSWYMAFLQLEVVDEASCSETHMALRVSLPLKMVQPWDLVERLLGGNAPYQARLWLLYANNSLVRVCRACDVEARPFSALEQFFSSEAACNRKSHWTATSGGNDSSCQHQHLRHSSPRD